MVTWPGRPFPATPNWEILVQSQPEGERLGPGVGIWEFRTCLNPGNSSSVGGGWGWGYPWVRINFTHFHWWSAVLTPQRHSTPPDAPNCRPLGRGRKRGGGGGSTLPHIFICELVKRNQENWSILSLKVLIFGGGNDKMCLSLILQVKIASEGVL